MSSGSSLRNLVLTPDRIPSFFVPSRSPFLSPRPRLTSSDRTRLLSDHDDDGPETSPPADPQSRSLLRLPTPRVRRPRPAEDSQDVDLTTRAALSLPHVGKVTTPYGFRAVLAASPCTRRRESLFHRNKPVTVTVMDEDLQDSEATLTRVSTQPVRALGRQVLKELKRPAAMLKALSPAPRR
ncbi:C2 calcium-dependent domain-containing protein 4C-like [Halichoeres trimaculatus]|uniref:C2 calcium-dependent domain-containing protein 4C-like n=1 Tax=Halichoeres trimaculatus TaxID=147232 RepID=UPI003D9E5994